jgi:hypothetical protein
LAPQDGTETKGYESAVTCHRLSGDCRFTLKGADGLGVIGNEHMLIADEPEQFAARTVQLIHDTHWPAPTPGR